MDKTARTTSATTKKKQHKTMLHLVKGWGRSSRELICLLLFTCSCMVSIRRGFIFLWVLGMGCVILLLHSLSLPYHYYTESEYLPYPRKHLQAHLSIDVTKRITNSSALRLGINWFLSQHVVACDARHL